MCWIIELLPAIIDDKLWKFKVANDVQTLNFGKLYPLSMVTYEIFWIPVGFESANNSLQSDAQYWLKYYVMSI